MMEMEAINRNWLNYVILLAVLIASFVGALVLPVSETFKDFVAVPGAVALLGFLYQLWRDHTAHERALALQNRQQDFALGTASHMAEVAYDKHVAFCEEYMARIQLGFQELMGDGPTAKSANIGGDLVRIRFKHAAWLTTTIEAQLKPYEMAVITMGAQMGTLDRDTRMTDERRTEVVNEIYKAYGLVGGFDKAQSEEEGLIHLQKPIENVRRVLGIDTLMALRQAASDLAIERLSQPGNPRASVTSKESSPKG